MIIFQIRNLIVWIKICEREQQVNNHAVVHSILNINCEKKLQANEAGYSLEPLQ